MLELQEDMAIQAQVAVSYQQGGAARSVSQAVNATLYRNTALTWEDTRRISSFITPNEQTVDGFAARVLAAGAPSRLPLSKKIFQAMRIFDALGTYGIVYVEDPDSPFSKALGKAEVVDTVRFPRITLSNRTGDCDDTTALVCSLLESAGIRTAVLTTPGAHLHGLRFRRASRKPSLPFLPRPRGHPERRVHMDSTGNDGCHTGIHGGLGVGLRACEKYDASGPFEFIPVASMRDAYPALPLPPSAVSLAEPSAAQVDTAFTVSSSGFIAALYTATDQGAGRRPCRSVGQAGRRDQGAGGGHSCAFRTAFGCGDGIPQGDRR